MRPAGWTCVVVALAFGLVAGIGEGLGSRWCQQHGLDRWPVSLHAGPEILWVSPLLDALLFGLVGLAMAALARVVGPRFPAVAATAAASAAALGFDWLRVTPLFGRAAALGTALLLGLTLFLLVRRREDRLVRPARWVALVAGGATLVAAVTITGAADWRERRALARIEPPPAGTKNVLVLVWDTVRSDHLSAYGYARATTPNLERLAREGARFDDLFSTSSWTLPAHASMLTGRLPYEHGAELLPLDGRCPMLGEILGAAGFRTGAFSGNLCYFTRRWGFGRSFQHFDDFDWCWASRLVRTLPGREVDDLVRHWQSRKRELVGKSATDVVDGFLAWLDADHGRPFFAFLNFFDAHDPFEPPPAFMGRFEGDGRDPPAPTVIPDDASAQVRDPKRLAADAREYDECILYCDAELGRLVDELSRRGSLDDTLLVVTSDHGESLGERGALFHRGSLHREQVEVPLVIRAPGQVAAGRVVDAVASLAALPATLLDLLGLPGSAAFPSGSLAPLLLEHDVDRGAGDTPAAFLELARHPWAEYRRRPCFKGAARSVVVGRWHYLRHDTLGEQLFDRIADPREEHDLHSEHRDVTAALSARLDAELAKLDPHPRTAISDEELAGREGLAGIGYTSDDR